MRPVIGAEAQAHLLRWEGYMAYTQPSTRINANTSSSSLSSLVFAVFKCVVHK